MLSGMASSFERKGFESTERIVGLDDSSSGVCVCRKPYIIVTSGDRYCEELPLPYAKDREENEADCRLRVLRAGRQLALGN